MTFLFIIGLICGAIAFIFTALMATAIITGSSEYRKEHPNGEDCDKKDD